jgi:hypothetical protein
MAHEIEFLRQLEEDLRTAARDEIRERREPGLSRARWESARPVIAVASGLLVLSITAFAIWTWVDRRPNAGQRPDIPSDRVGPVRAGRPGPPPTGTQLFAVDAVSAKDVWAVGRRFTEDPFGYTSLILHWDGAAWVEVQSPDIVLTDIAAVSSTDVWAIGGDIDATRIFHWDGTSWEAVPHPKPPGASFTAIAARSANDVWVVGIRYGTEWKKENFVGYDTLVEHWDGTRWTVVPSPNPTLRHNSLKGVVALSPTDVWAVGYSEGKVSRPKTLTLHWDGTAWSIVPSPNPGQDFNVLWGMGTDGVSGVWAVGHYGDPEPSRIQALYLRWGGREWEMVASPTGEAGHQTATALAGSSSSDIWAVGSEPTSSFLVAHWNGSAWTTVQAESPAAGQNTNPALVDVAVVSPTAAWAVGHYQRPDGRRIFAWLEHWDGTAWRPIDLSQIEIQVTDQANL